MNYNRTYQILLANGYAPAATAPEGGLPKGPWAVFQARYDVAADTNDLAAVLTSVAPPRGAGPGVIAEPSQTYLATLTVHVLPELVQGVQDIVERFAGNAKVLTRVDGHGARLYVFTQPDRYPFDRLDSDVNCRPDNWCRVESAASYVALSGDWTNSETPVTVKRSELASLSRTQAAELLDRLNAYFESQRPAAPPPSPRPAPRPVRLPPLARLSWGDTEAIERLRNSGFAVCPVPAGRQTPPGQWNRVWDDVEGSEDDNVGLLLSLPAYQRGRHGIQTYSDTYVAAVHIKTKLPEVLALMADEYGAGSYRLASDGTRTYFFRSEQPFAEHSLSRFAKTATGSYIPGTVSSVRIEGRDSVVLLSGVDENGKAFKWEGGSLLDTKRADLPLLNQGSVQALLGAVERLLGQRSRAA